MVRINSEFSISSLIYFWTVPTEHNEIQTASTGRLTFQWYKCSQFRVMTRVDYEKPNVKVKMAAIKLSFRKENSFW